MTIRSSTVAVVVLAAALTATAGASGLARPEVISVLDVPVTEASDPPDLFMRNAPPAVGSRFFFTDALYSWAGVTRGKRIGRLEGNCTFTGHPDAQTLTAWCAASAFLPAGQVAVGGSARFGEGPSTFTLPVLGGTGRYGNARGWVRVRDIGQTDNSALVFHLMP